VIDPKKPMNMAEHEHRALRAWTAAAEMINGTARREEWDDCADCINIVESLYDMGKLGEETMHWVIGAIRGMRDAIEMPDGQMRMHAGETVCLRHVVTLYDSALGKFARQTIVEAERRVVQKIALARVDPSSDMLVIDR